MRIAPDSELIGHYALSANPPAKRVKMPRAKKQRPSKLESREQSTLPKSIQRMLGFAGLDWEKGFNAGYKTAARDQLSLNPNYRGTGVKFDRSDLDQFWFCDGLASDGKVRFNPEKFKVVHEPSASETRAANKAERDKAKAYITSQIKPHCEKIGLDPDNIDNLKFAFWDYKRTYDKRDTIVAKHLREQFPTMTHWRNIGKPETTIHSIGGVQIKKRQGIGSGKTPMSKNQAMIKERRMHNPEEQFAIVLSRFVQSVHRYYQKRR